MKYELFIAHGNGEAGSVFSDDYDTLLLLGRAAVSIGVRQAEIHWEDGCYDIGAEE